MDQAPETTKRSRKPVRAGCLIRPFKKEPMNTAQQIHQFLGVADQTASVGNQRNKSSTKAGPGRRHKQGDGTGKNKTVKQKRVGMFGKGLRNAITAKQQAELA